jgi:hypothetical protein
MLWGPAHCCRHSCMLSQLLQIHHLLAVPHTCMVSFRLHSAPVSATHQPVCTACVSWSWAASYSISASLLPCICLPALQDSSSAAAAAATPGTPSPSKWAYVQHLELLVEPIWTLLQETIILTLFVSAATCLARRTRPQQQQPPQAPPVPPSGPTCSIWSC